MNYRAWYSTEPSGNVEPWQGDINNPQEGIILNPAKAPIEDNLKVDKLTILGRPYPYFVAGTPIAYQFNTTTRIFTLHYTTKAVGKPITNPTTVIVVSKRLFPQGYTTTVLGGKVTSGPDAQSLTVVAGAGVHSINVTVRPL